MQAYNLNYFMNVRQFNNQYNRNKFYLSRLIPSLSSCLRNFFFIVFLMFYNNITRLIIFYTLNYITTTNVGLLMQLNDQLTKYTYSNDK